MENRQAESAGRRKRAFTLDTNLCNQHDPRARYRGETFDTHAMRCRVSLRNRRTLPWNVHRRARFPHQ